MAQVGQTEAAKCQAACGSKFQLMNDAMNALNTTGHDDAVDVVADNGYLTFVCR